MATFMTYAGSKEKLSDQLSYFFNQTQKNTFVDLFCGAGSIAASCELGRFSSIIENDVDKNLILAEKNMIEIFKEGRIDEQFKELLKMCPSTQEEYVDFRNRYNASCEGKWKEFIVLASCCTNNMVRFNKKMEFNQTYGKRKLNEHSMQRMKEYCEKMICLKNILFKSADFNSEDYSDSLIYIDPPYSNSQVKYISWNNSDDKRLSDYIERNYNLGNDIIVSSFIKNGELSELENNLESMHFERFFLDQDYLKGARKKTNEYQEVVYEKMHI
jgi:DNA adenine methylase Dam